MKSIDSSVEGATSRGAAHNNTGKGRSLPAQPVLHNPASGVLPTEKQLDDIQDPHSLPSEPVAQLTLGDHLPSRSTIAGAQMGALTGLAVAGAATLATGAAVASAPFVAAGAVGGAALSKILSKPKPPLAPQNTGAAAPASPEAMAGDEKAGALPAAAASLPAASASGDSSKKPKITPEENTRMQKEKSAKDREDKKAIAAAASQQSQSDKAKAASDKQADDKAKEDARVLMH